MLILCRGDSDGYDPHVAEEGGQEKRFTTLQVELLDGCIWVKFVMESKLEMATMLVCLSEIVLLANGPSANRTMSHFTHA